METEGELQSGYLTGTKPTAARRPKGGVGDSINTHSPNNLLPHVQVFVCASAERMRTASCKAAIHLGHQHNREPLHFACCTLSSKWLADAEVR